MNRPDSLKQRVEFLEREIASLRDLRREEIPGVYDRAPSPRLARTIDDGSYPTAPATIYPIVFLDGSFNPVAGNATPTFTPQSVTCQANAYAVSDAVFLEPGTIGKAWRQNGRYWFDPLASAAPHIYRAETLTSVAAGSTTTVTVYPHTAFDDPFPQTGVRHDWMTGGQSIAAGKEIIIAFFHSERVWRIIGAEC